jgi:ribonuclease R
MEKLPSKDEILNFLRENPGLSAKRDIAKAFGIKGAGLRMELKRLLKEMEAEGALTRKARRMRAFGSLPPVALLRVIGPDGQGDLFAEATGEDIGDGPSPRILISPQKGDPALGAGDRILARLTATPGEGADYTARLIRRIGHNPLKILGIFRKQGDGGRIVPIDKGADKEWRVAADATNDARDGELVEAELAGPKRMGLPAARITARLGDPGGPRAISLIAIHQHGIPDRFPDAALAEAEAAKPAALGKRTDLRDMPLVTIDPVDARDRDDAVLAEADPDPQNKGGHILWVAIADVAHYVRPGGALDAEARRRGNSTYFPDRVVPMLPDVLSGDLCSLHEHVDRACLAVRMVINAEGQKIGHTFMRGLMRSQGSLHYVQAQAAIDGAPDDQTGPLLEPVLKPLWAAYAALKRARAERQPLELDLPERKIILGEDGKVLSVAFPERLDAHRLIEEFMVLANVASAEELNARRAPLLFRVHEEPSPEKLDALREVAEGAGFTLAKGQVLKTRHLNNLLAQSQGTEFDELMNISTLRSMTQAYYGPENLGHFGLALRNYAHFTSPIRRYSDLIVHRALIAAHDWGKDGLTPADIEKLAETGKLISDSERRSMAAERDTNDRYLAAYLSDRVGASFEGRISGVQKFGLFVRLIETGADGLIPVRSLGREFFRYDEGTQTLTGEETGQILGLGQKVTVKLAEAVPVTGGLTLELVAVDGAHLRRAGMIKGRRAPAGRGRPDGGAKRRVVRRRKG